MNITVAKSFDKIEDYCINFMLDEHHLYKGLTKTECLVYAVLWSNSKYRYGYDIRIVEVSPEFKEKVGKKLQIGVPYMENILVNLKKANQISVVKTLPNCYWFPDIANLPPIDAKFNAISITHKYQVHE